MDPMMAAVMLGPMLAGPGGSVETGPRNPNPVPNGQSPVQPVPTNPAPAPMPDIRERLGIRSLAY